jgi:hypothetical protein
MKSIQKRTTIGGTSLQSVKNQIAEIQRLTSALAPGAGGIPEGDQSLGTTQNSKSGDFGFQETKGE